MKLNELKNQVVKETGADDNWVVQHKNNAKKFVSLYEANTLGWGPRGLRFTELEARQVAAEVGGLAKVL